MRQNWFFGVRIRELLLLPRPYWVLFQIYITEVFVIEVELESNI